MPKVKGEEDELDPIVQAALVDEEDDDEEEKQLKKEALGLDDEDTTEETAETGDKTDDEEATTDTEDDSDTGADGEEDSEEADEDSDEEREEDQQEKVDKPTEAADDEDVNVPSRKDRREARKQAFMDDIYKNVQPYNQQRYNVDYQPLNYEDKEEFNPDELKTDREKYGQVQYVKGAEEVKYWAEQDNFFKELDYENRILTADPDMRFLSDTLPNGKPNPEFDPEKTADINEMYLNLVGYKEQYRTDAQGNVLIDQTGQPLTYATVDRTDISYEKFARKFVERMKSWASNEADEIADEKFESLKKRNKNRSVRPSGKRKSRIGELRPGVIASMSDEDLEAHEEEIDNRINSMLGL